MDGDRPVRVEPRRADGFSLARLPWADRFAGDDGAALRTFLAASGLGAGQEGFTPDRRETITALPPVAPTFGSAGLLVAQLAAKRDSGWMGNGRVPDWQPVIPAGSALIGALGPADEPLIALAAGLAILLSLSPQTSDMVRRGLDRKILR
jgi:hypothetical protein